MLSLEDNGEIGDAGVAAIAEHLPRTIRRICLRKTGVGDAGFASLVQRLPPEMERLDIIRTEVRESGLAALLAKLPMEYLTLEYRAPESMKHVEKCRLRQGRTNDELCCNTSETGEADTMKAFKRDLIGVQPAQPFAVSRLSTAQIATVLR